MRPGALPPMLARPNLAHVERERAGARRRDTLARKTAYRQDLLRLIAHGLENGIYDSETLRSMHGLSFEQVESIEHHVASVLRNAADNYGGRLGKRS